MPHPILRLLPLLLLVAPVVFPAAVHARTLQARITRVNTPVARMEGVTVRLDWPAHAPRGELLLTARRVDAPDLGYRYRDLTWRCPLHRDGKGGWRCEGMLGSGRGSPLRLSVDLGPATTDAVLARGSARFALARSAATPDLTTLDLTRVPIAWSQSLLSQAWAAGRLKAGTLDGRLRVHTPKQRPLRVEGNLVAAGVGVETPDAAIAAENLGGRFAIDYRKTPRLALLTLDGELRGGEFLVGNTYVALPPSPVAMAIEGRQPAGEGWQLPRIAWRDGEVLTADGSAAFAPDAKLHSLDITARSRDMAPLRERYLSGWLGLFGLGQVGLRGGADLHVRVDGGRLAVADATLHGVDLRDPADRFGFTALDGDIRFSSTAPVQSTLRWRGGKLYGLDFGPASMPIASRDGVLVFRDKVVVPSMGGNLTFENVTFRPPAGGAGADIQFALTLDAIDFGQVSKAVGLPAFQGRLSGRIPNARYANERLDFDGGLSMQLFDGTVEFSSLSMERPFGTAPTLSADIVFDDLDLLRLTEVLGFGTITGRLDGRIDDLRLVDWSATAFDAELRSDRKRGVRQRISQRAVQNISSVGDASFVSSLQGQLIGLFDDFGYRRIGIACRLANEVCDMSGLEGASARSDSAGFTIVEGSGLPRLTVVGYNRRVDWPTLVERLTAVGKGEVKPVVE